MFDGRLPSATRALSSALSPLARARLDELLEELLQRVGAFLDSQERLRGLLDAVVVIARTSRSMECWNRSSRAASRLVDAQYVALGVLGPGASGASGVHHHRLSDASGADRRPAHAARDCSATSSTIRNPCGSPIFTAHPGSYGFPPNHPPMTSFLGDPDPDPGQGLRQSLPD